MATIIIIRIGNIPCNRDGINPALIIRFAVSGVTLYQRPYVSNDLYFPVGHTIVSRTRSLISRKYAAT